MAAQVAHASLGALLKHATSSELKYKNDRIKLSYMPHEMKSIRIDFTHQSPLDCWLNGKFTKIVLAVDSEEELLNIFKLAEDKELNPVLITDAGLTEFNGIPTNTCVGIGPFFVDALEGVTDKLKIFR
jgi:peptidyl-tRNA hydrolase